MRAVFDILEDLRKITNPGEYGLGTEAPSIPDDNKKAWERVGELHDELEKELCEIQSDLLHVMERMKI